MAREFQRHPRSEATEINHSHRHEDRRLAMVPATLIDPGDVTLMTVPGYPVAGTLYEVLRR